MSPTANRIFAASLLLALALRLSGQTIVGSGQPAAPPTETASATAPEALPASSWQFTATLRGSIGWRDNVLLSPFDPIDRPLARAEAEVFVYRPFGDRGEFLSFISGDVLRYTSPPDETDGEEQWFAHGEVRWKPIPRVRLALKTVGFLQDTVIDLSETEDTRVVAPTRVQGGYVTGLVRVTLPAGFTLEPLVQAKRTDYREFPGDFDAVQVGARLEWKRTDALALSVAAFEQERRYATRSRYSASGRPLPGTRLRFKQREGEVRASTSWTARGKWEVSAMAGRLENRDNGSGFFDYDQNRARLGTEWEGAVWRWMIEGDARRTEYLFQTVGAGMFPPARMAEYFETKVRGERRLGDKWMLFAEHRWERNRSNEFGFSYKANTVLAGIQRDF